MKLTVQYSILHNQGFCWADHVFMILRRIFGGEASLKIPVWEIKMCVDDFLVDVSYTGCRGVVMKDTGLGACVTVVICFGSVSFDSLEVINMKKQKIIEFLLHY